MPASEPLLLYDRYPAGKLAADHPALHNYLTRMGAVTSDLKTVQYCGLVVLKGGPSYMFLPRTAHRENGRLLSDAVQTMAALVKFERSSERSGLIATEGRGGTIAPVIQELATDFRDHGIYNERLRIKTRNAGKTDWKRTISGLQPVLIDDGPVYTEMLTTRPVSSDENILAVIQSAIVTEIFSKHKWWLSNSLGHRPPPLPVVPRHPRGRWIALLRKYMRNLYMDRPLRLARLLCEYLEADAENPEGSFFCGVKDFHAVWEAMLAAVLNNTEPGWRKRLPLPHYISRDGKRHVAGDMIPDIVLRTDEGLLVVDAKYYRADTAASSPHLGDILKQISYLNAVRTVEPETPARTCFVFPGSDDDRGSFEKVQFFGRDGKAAPEFDDITCYYFSMMRVIELYRNHRTENFDRLADLPDTPVAAAG